MVNLPISPKSFFSFIQNIFLVSYDLVDHTQLNTSFQNSPFKFLNPVSQAFLKLSDISLHFIANTSFLIDLVDQFLDAEVQSSHSHSGHAYTGDFHDNLVPEDNLNDAI